jgi:hypothetical protein
MKPGDRVRKRSNKPFQNGEKTAIVESVSTMEIPPAHRANGVLPRIEKCVSLVGCNGPVATAVLVEVNDGER